ncbi:VWA domain-containing protein [soil metagenome]
MLPVPEETYNWLRLEWFSLSVLRSFDWQNPLFLYGLLAVPLFFLLRWLLFVRVRKKLDFAMFEGEATWHWSSLLRYIPGLLFGLFMVFLLVSLARPQRTDERVNLSTEGIDVLLLLDTSGSMALADFKPNRLEAAKEVAIHFINGRYQDRIGVVVFAGEAYSLVPLTTDYDLLRESIKSIHLDMFSNDGTAIGNALGVAINRMRESSAVSKVGILISDGENTAGSLDPLLSAQLAQVYGIKLYTIGIGQDGKIPVEQDGQLQYVETRLEEATLREIAQIGHGQFFRATTEGALEEVFRQIDGLEKAEVVESRFRDTKDYYQVYLKWAILFFLGWLALKNTFFCNALED